MATTGERSYPLDGSGPVTWTEVQRVLSALLRQAAVGALEPEQAAGPLNQELIDVVEVHRRRHSAVVGQEHIGAGDARDILAGDIEHFVIHGVLEEIARDRRAGVCTEEEAVRAIVGELDFELQAKVEPHDVLTGDEGPLDEINEAIVASGGPVQYADRIMKQVLGESSAFGRHTREALKKGLKGPNRPRLLAQASPNRISHPEEQRRALLRYVFELLDLRSMPECEEAIKSTFERGVGPLPK